jgi:hypothetical protein
LQCFKTHQNQCEAAIDGGNEVSDSVLQAGASTSSSKQTDAGVVAGKSLRKEDLEKMFDTHPELKAKLKAIYDATLDPRSNSAHADGPGHFDRKWSEAKGFARGMDLLQRGLDSDAVDAEDVRMFAAYVAANSG